MTSKAEKSYIQAGILSSPPSRADGRALFTFRNIALDTNVAPLANGSARLSIGRNPHDGSGGSEVLAATKLEVESVGPGSEGVDGGRIVCIVTCSPAAYPLLTTSALEDLQTDYTSVLHNTLSHPSLRPSNLTILPGLKSWLLYLDIIVLSDAGNIFDALFFAARAALSDTKVPRTKSVEYRAAGAEKKKSSGGIMGSVVKGGSMDVDEDDDVTSSFDTRQLQRAIDFELDDYWDEGGPLDGANRWPVCVTLNIITHRHFLDATIPEEASTPLRLLLMFSFSDSSSTKLQGMRTFGAGELTSNQLSELIQAGEKYAREIWDALAAKLRGDKGYKLSKGKEKEKSS